MCRHIYYWNIVNCDIKNQFISPHFGEKSWVHMHYAAKRQNPIFRAVSPVSQNLYVEYLIRINIFMS